MRLIIFIILFSLPSFAMENRMSLSMGVPDFLQAGVLTPLSSTTWFGLSLGGFAGKPVVPDLNGTIDSKMNDRYSVVINPDANIFSSSVYLRYYPWRGRSFFDFKWQMLIVNATGKAALKNNDTSDVVTVGNVDVTLIEPVTSISYGYEFYKTDSTQGIIGLGVSYFFPAAVKSRVTGPLPAFLNVSPEYRDTVDGSTNRAQEDISELLNKTFDRYRLLPNIFVGVTW